MVGSVQDAEDLVQEAFLRWAATDREQVHSPKDYLCTVVTRLAIDHLRSARVRREQYVGPWLPEPVAVSPMPDPGEQVVLDESISLAFLVVLESLAPVERAVFLLREVFGYEYGEIAAMVGKAEANCRQIFHRAQERVRAGRPRFPAGPQEAESVARRFMEACATGDLAGLMGLLAPEVVAVADGGGQAHAALRPVEGAAQVARYLLGLARLASNGASVRPALVGGHPGCVIASDGRPVSLLALQIADRRIESVMIIVNPDKLRNVPTLA